MAHTEPTVSAECGRNLPTLTALYNDTDPYVAQWLRNLIAAGHIAPGVVDERSILDIEPDYCRRFTQCHFFAGIGGWSHALRLAGWPDDRPVWTGSCPCQPFSAAGKRSAFDDERHLWPHWHHLIAQCRPPRVFGEQVASVDGLAWLDVVLSDLEGSRYACAAVDLCAAGVGAPHIRQRLYFVAESRRQRQQGIGLHLQPRPARLHQPQARRNGEAGSVDDADSQREEAQFGVSRRAPVERARGHWSAAEWLPCRDGKARPVEPGTFPLAHGIPNRVGRLRAYGNAIVPQVAAAFIEACMNRSHG